MLTPENVDLAYQKALAALNATIRSSDATKEEVELAKKKRNDLTKNFIDQALADSAALTAQFQQFIGEMEALIAKFDPATTIAGIVQLKDVVDEAAMLVLAATTAAPLAGGAAGMHAIASTSGTVPAAKASPAPKGKISAKPAGKAKARPASKAAKPGAKGAAKPAKPRSKPKAAAKPPAKKAAAGRKSAGKKAAPAKRAPARKPAAKKAAATKRSAKKPAARKPAARGPK